MKAPASIVDLEDRLSEPSAALVDGFREFRGTLLLLGVGGKMGPSTARMAQRAAMASGSSLRVIGVSRFRDEHVRETLEHHGVSTIAGDLFDHAFVDQLPEADYVVSLLGAKFGTEERPDITWATNTYLAGLIANRFRSRPLTVLSTGNVYALVDVAGRRGSRESDPQCPVGEYAQSAVGRERVCDFFSRRHATPMSIIRLNYAVEMRYGVLVDLASQIMAGAPASLKVGAFNVIWQRDASDWVLRSLLHAQSPPKYLNVAGPEILFTRETCQQLATSLSKPLHLTGAESGQALLSDAAQAYKLFGKPTISADTLIDWTADWIARSEPVWNKPTHFEQTDGKF